MDKLKYRQKRDNYSEIFIRIDRIIRNEQLFLDPSLSLGMLCKYVGTNRTYASRAIASRYKNFRTYLKVLRLEYFFKGAFSDVALYGDWIESEELAYKCGFSSRRGLDRALTDQAGITYSKIVRNRPK